MRKFLILLLPLFLLLSAPARAIELGGITMPDQLSTDEDSLSLNGAGIRSKFVFDLYVAGLYLKQQNADPKAVIMSDETMAIRLHIISAKITSEKMIKATREGFEKSTLGLTVEIANEIDQFLNAFSEPINEGDVFEFIYRPANGLTVNKNNVEKINISSLVFKQALFGIWLSDQPVQKKLKNALLGK